MNTASLFSGCPLAGCHNPVDDPRRPCGECLTLFGEYIQQGPGEPVSADEFARVSAAADARVREVLAERAALELAAAAPPPSAEPKPGAERCWSCTRQR